jgi:hypothetical protein
MKFREFDNNLVRRIKGNGYIKTDVPMEKRTLGNLPRYANKKARVHFRDWMGIKGEKTNPSNSVTSFGKAEADGKWYGWSHRAIAGFGVGDVVKADTCGNTKGEYTIKTDDQAKETAINFANDVS